MAIQFPCGKCGALIEVDDQCTGGQCKCAACHATTDIPRVSFSDRRITYIAEHVAPRGNRHNAFAE